MRAKIGSAVRVSGALLGLHALTGCDSCSAFKKRGKKAAIDFLLSNENLCSGLKQLGQDFNVTKQLHTICEKFVCL